jgi:hypothetical protein
MRELYTSRAAERVGVPREVVADEAARGPSVPPPGAGPGIRPPRAPADVRSGEPAPAAPRTSRFGARAERQLLRAMLVAPEWREIARRELPPELLEVPALRELYVALGRLPAGDPGTQLPEALSPDAATAWTELRDGAAGLSSEQASEDYVSAQQTLAARPEYRSIVRLTDPTEKARRLAELDARFPAFARKRGYVRSGQQSRRRQPHR